MATSILERLLSPWKAPEGKAAFGPGVHALTWSTPIHSLARQPNRLMSEAQALYHTSIWVNAAERAITGRFVRMDWHLEDEAGETITAESDEPYQAVLRLMERPSPRMTRRQLWGITARHDGLCGNAAWYLDQRDALAGTPLQILYVNPARLTPATNDAGYVVGWVLDSPDNPVSGTAGREGVPLSTEELIHFTFDEPDWGTWGVGIAEAAQRKIDLTRLTDSHMAQVLGSGGRLTGLVTPKAGETIAEDHWTQFARDWRRIAEDPDAAKRLQIAKMPLDFTQMTASPQELQLVEVGNLGRDDTLAAWGVPLSQLGITHSRGLNSGEAVKYEEAALWQGAIETRADGIREKIQYELLDRFAVLGVVVKLVFDYPEFDDETPRYENATKAKVIPLSVDQRLEMVGKDPLDETIYGQLGQAIYMDQTMVPLFDPTLPAEPAAPPEPGPVQPETTASTVAEEAVVAKAGLTDTLLTLRAKVEQAWEPKMRAAIAAVLTEQRRFVTSKAAHLLREPKDTTWWNEAREQRRFLTALEPLIVDMAAQVAGETRRKVPSAKKADSFLERVLDMVRKTVGERIDGINLTTREKVQAAVAAGVEAGDSPAELGVRIRDSAAFDEYRSELIARTETAHVYNDAAIESYRSLAVEEVQAIDGDDDADCAARDGRIYSLDDAQGISDHPNGTLDWIPVMKAAPDPLLVLAEAVKANTERPPTIMNVGAPQDPPPGTFVFTMPELAAPTINYTPPELPALDTSLFAQALYELRNEIRAPRTKRIVRDENNVITGVIEESA